MARILVVEDHPSLAASIAGGLTDEGHRADVVHDGQAALDRVLTESYDLILLDLMIPKKDGYAVLQTLRGAGHRTPVLCLTARDALDDKVRGLNLGADDYLVKPFEWEELLARVRVLIRRAHGQHDSTLRIADLEIDTVARTVRRKDQPISLTGKEYALLLYLAYRQDRVMSRADIWENLYDEYAGGTSNVVDVYIGYLRNKIDRGHAVKLIHTRRGVGYLLSAAPDGPPDAPADAAT